MSIIFAFKSCYYAKRRAPRCINHSKQPHGCTSQQIFNLIEVSVTCGCSVCGEDVFTLQLTRWKCCLSRALDGISDLGSSNYKQVFSSDVFRLCSAPHRLFSWLAYCLSLVVVSEKSRLRGPQVSFSIDCT